jgi:hypothetical protein
MKERMKVEGMLYINKRNSVNAQPLIVANKIYNLIMSFSKLIQLNINYCLIWMKITD